MMMIAGIAQTAMEEVVQHQQNAVLISHVVDVMIA